MHMYFSALLCELWTTLMFAGSALAVARERRNTLCFAALFGIVGVALCLLMKDFAIDDSLISVRYARNLASGIGYRFNAGDPSTDGVTPLPWAFMLAPLARADALSVLHRARFLGGVIYVVTLSAVGWQVGKRETLAMKVAAFALAGVSAAPAAYAMSGMETSVAMGFVTLAVLFRERPLLAATYAGLAVAFRPEAAGFAVAFSLVLGFEVEKPIVVVRHLGLSLLPLIVTSIVRYSVWGVAIPLAAIAKPSSPSLGFTYAGAGVLSTGVLVVACAPIALMRAHRKTQALAVGLVAHFMCIALAGGDWMPLARLWVPVLLVVPLLFLEVALTSAPWSLWFRWTLAMALAIGFGGRGILLHRVLLPARLSAIAQATSLLRGQRVAAVDVGWVSAATEGYIFDMAGVTNPLVASLPGGHTSKRISGRMLRDRDITRVLLWASDKPPSLERWKEATFPRHAERRLAYDLESWPASAWVPIGSRGGYILLSRPAE